MVYVPDTANRPHIAFLYYVNDSDGDTIIFNEKEGHIGELTIKTRVSPKKGRLIIFGGNIYHAAGRPKKDIRCVINYNFV